jgi:hypothetical protein
LLGAARDKEEKKEAETVREIKKQNCHLSLQKRRMYLFSPLGKISCMIVKFGCIGALASK